MRTRWKEVGLGLLTLLAVILTVVVCQPVYRKVLPSGVGPAAIALTVFLVYVAGARWIERRPARGLPPVAHCPNSPPVWSLDSRSSRQ